MKTFDKGKRRIYAEGWNLFYAEVTEMPPTQPLQSADCRTFYGLRGVSFEHIVYLLQVEGDTESLRHPLDCSQCLNAIAYRESMTIEAIVDHLTRAVQNIHSRKY